MPTTIDDLQKSWLKQKTRGYAIQDWPRSQEK